jgi:hypothetical protein
MSRVGGLAAFLGPDVVNRSFVPSIMWLPNEPDWRMRATFYRHLPELAASVVRLLHLAPLFVSAPQCCSALAAHFCTCE